MDRIRIKPKEKSAIIESFKVGIVPKIGLEHICVGRKAELEQMIHDFTLISEGGAKTRFIIGEFGSGKTFFLTLTKLIAHAKNLVVLTADITTEKYLCATDHRSQALFSELISNMSTKTKPDGNALSSIVERWASNILAEKQDISENEVYRLLHPLEKYVACYDFSKVISNYIFAYKEGNDLKMAQSLRWLKAEYSTKTEARNDLNVRTIIDDSNFYDYLKLFAGFIKLAGYDGLIVNIDELAVLSRLKSNIRNKNFERILNIVNDSFQGTSEYIGFIFGGTPDFLQDPYKGMYSYGALETRLRDNPFSQKDLVDLTGPVIRLGNLSIDDLFVLFHKIRDVFAEYDEKNYLLDENGIKIFLEWITNRLGAKSYLSPRESIKNFVGLLSQLQNYPNTNIESYLGKIVLEEKSETDNEDELVNLKLCNDNI